MAFLNSLFLWGLVAAAVPLIIHLIKRNKAIKLPFAAMRFLQLNPNRKVKSQRLKQIILLLMRMAALAVLAFGFARPFFEDAQTKIWSDQPKSAVLLIDNSLSMRYGTRFDDAIAKARELLDNFNPGDKVAIMQFAEGSTVLMDTDNEFSAMANRIGLLIKPTNFGTNYANAIQAAETYLLDTPFETKLLYLITDMQQSGLENLYTKWELQPGVQLEIVSVNQPEAANLAVNEVLVSGYEGRHKTKDVLAKVKLYGSGTKKVAVALTVAGELKGRHDITLGTNQEQLVQFKDVRFPEGQISGFVEVNYEKDPIQEDNRFYFVTENRTETQLLAVNGEPEQRDPTQDELFFVDRAINVPELSRYRLERTTPQGVGTFNLENYRAIMLANIKDLSRDFVERLQFYVRSGGGLIISLGDRTNPTIFNQLLRDLAPAIIESRAFDSIDRENNVIIGEVDYQHPIFRIFADASNTDPSTAQFFQYYQCEPLGRSAVLASFDDGGPALLERSVGVGKVLLFTSSLDTEWNNLPVKAIFLPLLHEFLDYVASKRRGQKSYLVGQPIRIDAVSAGQLSSGQYELESPNQEAVPLESEIFDEATQPGIYTIKKEGQSRIYGALAVNIDARESDLAVASLADIRDKFAASSVSAIRTAAVGTPEFNQDAEGRQKLWRFAVLGVILLLIGETWLANRTYR